jgi:SAM-dependent methyltransferase
MTETHDQYFEYLMTRSRLGHAYRQHLLYPRLVRRLRGRLLDVGCGVGDMLAFRSNSVGVDINARTVDYCRRRGQTAYVMVADSLPFNEASFDSVLLDNVLEHIAVPLPLLAEIHRVLSPGGRLLVGVPGIKGWHSDPDHKIFYDEVSLSGTVSRSGFSLAELFHTPFFFRSNWLSHRVRQYCAYGAFDRVKGVM